MLQWLKHALCFLVGGFSAIIAITSSLLIWIFFFDNDGGEPGATTIFNVLLIWPFFLIFVVIAATLCAIHPRSTLWFTALTTALFISAWITILISRAQNA